MSKDINTREYMIYPMLINTISCCAGLFCLYILMNYPQLAWYKQVVLGWCVFLSFLSLMVKSVSRRYYELLRSVVALNRQLPQMNPHIMCILGLIMSAAVKIGFPWVVVFL